MFIAGIDEAGRGPVIGSMYMAIALINIKDLEILENLGVKDSKLLSKTKRNEIYNDLKDILVEYNIVKINAQNIDALRKKKSLNMIESDLTIKLINSLQHKPTKIYIDCPDANIEKYKNIIYSSITFDTNLVVEYKADLNYIITASASILAKVERDKEIDKISHKIGVNVGSGYPSDPNTKAFLQTIDITNIPNYVRKSWQTIDNLINSKKQQLLK